MKWRTINFDYIIHLLTFLDGKLGDLEKRTCQVLCRLRDEGEEAKEVSSIMKLVIHANLNKKSLSPFPVHSIILYFVYLIS